jgi:hypothetical protein
MSEEARGIDMELFCGKTKDTHTHTHTHTLTHVDKETEIESQRERREKQKEIEKRLDTKKESWIAIGALVGSSD